MCTKRHFVISSVIVVSILSLALPAFAGKNCNGNGYPSGSHYEFGLIGRPNDYQGSGDTGTNRNNIFVPLNTSGEVDGKVKIYITQGAEFKVLDGDATDGEGRLQIGPGYYAVFARALGKPDANMLIEAYFTYWIEEGQLSDAIWVGNVDLTRGKGKPVTKEITGLFQYTGKLTYIEGGEEVTYDFTNTWVFDIPFLYEYWWDVFNNNLKRAEFRFYKVAPGYIPEEGICPPEF